jgi:hypothetical protein
MMNISVILCAIAGIFGLFALIKWFFILKPDVYTNAANVTPIIITTIAWLSAAVTFYQTSTFDSPIDMQRLWMIIGWAWLIYQLKVNRDNNVRKDKIIQSMRDINNQPTAN